MMKSPTRHEALMAIVIVWFTVAIVIMSKDGVTVPDPAASVEQLRDVAKEELERSNLASVVHSSFKSNQNIYCDVVVQPPGRQALGVVVDFTRNLSFPIKEPNAFYSVLAVSIDYHIVGGVYVASQAFRFHTETTFTLSLAPNTGYELLVHEMDIENRPPIGPSRILCSSNFETPHFPLGSRRNFPLCHSLNGIMPWDGHWVGPKFPIIDGSTAMRTGWRYIPHDCNLKTFTAPEIQSFLANNVSGVKPKTIVVLGSSIMRGVFLSLLDIIVDKEFKKDLARSKTGKCWGQASVHVGSLEVVYQDFRTTYMDPNADPRIIECHGDKLALASGLFVNATLMLKAMFAETNRPDVLFMAAYDVSSQTMKALMEMIPMSWKGRIVLGFGRFNALHDMFSEQEFQKQMDQAKEMRGVINDTRVQFVDINHVVSAMRLQAESVGRIAGSQHFHRFCSDGDLFVCSNVTEILAHFLINVAMSPGGKAMNWSDAKTAIKVIEPLVPRICTDCPERLLPFHIKPVPDLTCSLGAFEVAEKAGASWSDECPAFCLEVRSNGSIATQSGLAELRKCKLNG